MDLLTFLYSQITEMGSLHLFDTNNILISERLLQDILLYQTLGLWV